MRTFAGKRNANSMIRIFLTGYMGAGKTTLGKAFAREQGLSFIDLDWYIEGRYHKSIPQLFAERGEEGFRTLERNMLHEAGEFEDVVISTGGGTPCFFDNMDYMNSHGQTVFLDVCPDVLFRRLRALRPGLRVLFTVSPIRHWKDGAHGNQLSKAILLLAADRLVQAYDFVSYFPSYEIVMDELRDYRFYAPDMLHISEQGVDYIWERFRDLYFTPEARAVMREVEKCNKILAHRPAYPDSEETVRLRREAAEKRERLIRAARESACCRAGSST